MDNYVRLKKVIATALGIPEEEITHQLAVGVHPKWDSLGHLMLILAVEKEWNVKFK